MSVTSTPLSILAPLSGVLLPLASVPDPVFATGLVGAGVAIDPTSCEVRAPFAGTISQLHRACHAVAVRSPSGVEVLIHVGIDTVTLRGEGFTAHVRQGDTVASGQPLLSFDADAVARRATSLITMIVVTTPDAVSGLRAGSGKVRAGLDPALFATLAHSAGESVRTDAGPPATACVTLPNADGLHARPAALLAAAARGYTASLRLTRGTASADPRSVISVMLLGSQHGDSIGIEGRGADAQAAVDHLAQLLASGCGESLNTAPATATPPIPLAPVVTRAGVLGGVAASPGLAIGHVIQLRRAEFDIPVSGADLATETARLEQALADAAGELGALGAGRDASSRSQILAAHRELLTDPGLLDGAREELARGHSAAHAWRSAYTGYAARVAALTNALLRERAGDIRDVGERVLALLAGMRATAIDVPAGSVLVADELTPSQTAALDVRRVVGFCTTGGGATGHTAILARSLGIPAICGIDAAARQLANGTRVILDGDRGTLDTTPDAAAIASAENALARAAAAHARAEAVAGENAVTRDGHRIEVGANVRDAAETATAMQAGADGVGLLRSEFLFAERETAPSEGEQSAAYRAVARAVGPGRRLVVRTLDVGGDKPLPYLPLPHEDNPFLGVRGIRVGLAHPAMLASQLRAIATAAPLTQLCVMFPMIATLEELRAARALLEPISRASGQRIEIGVMIEVPSAALIAEQLAAEVDFFSIGTNDLTQYTLAMDRGHPQLAAQADGLHPAVLKLIAMTVAAAHRHGRWVGVCGGLAGDAIAVPALLGLGVDELSVSAVAVPTIKAQVRDLSMRDCQRLATALLELGTATEVRAALASFSASP
ncbi:MAG: phosphoenolpyruvate--protein phosphotransferase [Pseudomonadota bacterium]